MAYRHVRRIKRIYVDGIKREHLLPKTNTLLIGPTGCGKTFLVELLFQQILHLPTVIIDITTYSETGYVGQDPSTILTRLLHAADDNPCWLPSASCVSTSSTRLPRARTMPCSPVPEPPRTSPPGRAARAAQDAGVIRVVVPLEMTHSTFNDHVLMSTADVAFIAAGAFSGFHQLARRRAAAIPSVCRTPLAVARPTRWPSATHR